MKIFGTGIDIVEIARIQQSIDRYKENFAAKVPLLSIFLTAWYFCPLIVNETLEYP